MTDVFTRIAQAVPCVNQTAVVVAKALQDHWFAYYGIPNRLHSDQAQNFEGMVINELCKLYGIKKSRTTPYHPRGNPVERFNKTLCNLIKSVDYEKRRKWPDFLFHLTYIYNTTPHSITGIAPFVLMFGRQPTIPLDHLLDNTKEDWDQNFVLRQAQTLQHAHRLATSRTTKSRASDKRRWDRKALAKPLEIGDIVLLKRCAFRGRHKLEDHFLDDQFIITSINQQNDVYTIRPLLGGKEKKVNRELLILDPRNQYFKPLPEFLLEKQFETVDRDFSDAKSDSSSDDEWEFQIYPDPQGIMEQPQVIADDPENEFERVHTPPGSPGPVATPRRSQRETKGQHSNVHKLPRSTLN